MRAPDPSIVRYPGQWLHRDIHANGIRLHVAEALGPDGSGPLRDAPLVVLLHGFADFWWTWKAHLPVLAEAGFHVVAVDLRGYGDSDRPPRGYDGWTLANDIAGLIRALGHSSATLVGHGYGGMVCWATAALRPEVVDTLAVIGSPHPRALKRGVVTNPRQRRTWLPPFLGYQIPKLPEYRLTRRDAAAVDRMLRRLTTPKWADSTDGAATIARMRSAIQVPGAAHCALEYQRWAFRSQFRADGRRFMKQVDVELKIPVLAIHGEQDAFILASSIELSEQWAPNFTLRKVPGAAHLCHLEAAPAVSALLVDFLHSVQS